MYRRSIIPVAIFTALLSCSPKDAEQAESLFPTANVTAGEKVDALSAIFPDYRLIPLETNDSCLIDSKRIKILKRDSCYYVQSYNDILKFDGDGKFVEKLSKVGNARDEYPIILDFDIADINGRPEIMIAANKTIKRYDADTFGFIGDIKGEEYINQLHYVNDSTILTVSPDDVVFKVMTLGGKTRKSFMEKDLANAGQKLVQFRRLGDGRIAYQLDDTNNAVVYDEKSDSFSYSTLIPAPGKVLTVDDNREYFERYGFREQPKKISSEFICISSFQTNGDAYVITCFHPDAVKTMTAGNKDESVAYVYSDNGIGNLENDIQTSDMLFLSTLTCCDSDDGFLFMIPGESFADESMADQNPVLLEAGRICYHDQVTNRPAGTTER